MTWNLRSGIYTCASAVFIVIIFSSVCLHATCCWLTIASDVVADRPKRGGCKGYTLDNTKKDFLEG